MRSGMTPDSPTSIPKDDWLDKVTGDGAVYPSWLSGVRWGMLGDYSGLG